MNKKIIFVAILVSLLLVLASLAEGKKRGLRLGGKIKAAAKNVVSTVENTAKKAIDVATGIIKTVQGQDIVGTLPAVGKSVEKPVCPNNGVFGPSNVNGEKATEYKEQMQQKGCRFCTVDCAAIWSFAEQYESKWFDDFVKNPSKRPDLYVVEASTCKCRYYNYGCQLNTHCASYDSFDEMLTAISFCMIHSGCRFNSKIHNDATMRDFVSKFSQVGDIIMKPNTKLMTHETKVLQQMDARAGVIYHYKRVQDIRDFVMLSKSFEDYTNSSANWQLDQLPSYLYSAISAHPVTQKLYERVAYKINVLKYLPEDDVLMKVRQQANRQIQLEDRVSELYGKLKSGWNPFEKIEAAYDLANAYYDLLMNEIESLRLGAYLTLESAEQEEIHKKEIEKKAAERVAAAGERAELALFQLFLGGSFGMKMEAVKKLFKLLGKELQAKVMVHINKIAGKVSDAALLAIANAKNGALHAAREITGAANAAAYAVKEGLQTAGNEIAKHTTKYGGIAIDNVKNVGKKAVNKVKNFGKKSINKVKNFGKKAISKIGGGFRSFGRKLGGGFRKIGGGFRKIGGGFRSFGRKLGGGFRKISGGFRKIGGGFRSVGRKIGGGFRKIGGGFRSVGRKIGGGFRSAGRKLRRFFRRW